MTNPTYLPPEGNTPLLLRIAKELLSWFLYIVLALTIAVILNVFIFQITRVSGSSMYPTLNNGDLYVISKIGSTFNHCPDYEDIVVIDSRAGRVRTLKDDFVDVFHYNVITTTLLKRSDEHIYWVKRVIGLPGDTILLKNGRVFRNGEALTEEYINVSEFPRYDMDVEITVPEGYVWVMGDNRNHSTDSRVIGCVPIQNVIGRLKFPLKRMH